METDLPDQPNHRDAYIEVLTAIVQRFLKLMGTPAIKLARRVYGLRVDDDGNVTGFQGDGMVVVQGLVIALLIQTAKEIKQRVIYFSWCESLQVKKIVCVSVTGGGNAHESICYYF